MEFGSVTLKINTQNTPVNFGRLETWNFGVSAGDGWGQNFHGNVRSFNQADAKCGEK